MAKKDAKKEECCVPPHHCCPGCIKLCAVVLLVLGVLFLLRDLNVWDFWNIQWWTVLFFIFGVKMACYGWKK